MCVVGGYLGIVVTLYSGISRVLLAFQSSLLISVSALRSELKINLLIPYDVYNNFS